MANITTRITDSIAGTGTITTSTSSATVTGTSTQFINEVVVGNILKTNGGTTIGTVLTVNSNTSITLTTNAATAVTSASYNIVNSGVTLKNSPLSNAEIDANFLNVNNLKLERSRNLSDLPSISTAVANLGLTIGTNVQAFDSDLSAVAALSTTGIICRTGTGTASTRSITGVANEVLITNAGGVAGDIGITLGSNIPRLDATSNIFSGSITAQNFNSSSDQNLKENIQTITNATALVKQLNGSGFNWKKTGAKSYGVIAQELELILPELVHTENGVKSVEYMALIAFLINAVKELDARLETLENR